MSVYSKLLLARIRLQTMNLKKSGKNSFAGYDYYELQDFLSPIHGIMSDVGLFGWVTITREISTLTIVDLDDVTQMITFTNPTGSAQLKGCHEVQNIGAVETYQRRYLWMLAFEIVEPDMLDSTQGKQGNSGKQSKKQSADTDLLDQLQHDGELCYGDEWPSKMMSFCNKFAVAAPNQLSGDHIKTLLNGINKKLADQLKGE